MARPEVQGQVSPPVVTFMTTGHFVLRAARSAGVLLADVRHGVEGALGPVRGVVFVLVVNAGLCLDADERGW